MESISCFIGFPWVSYNFWTHPPVGSGLFSELFQVSSKHVFRSRPKELHPPGGFVSKHILLLMVQTSGVHQLRLVVYVIIIQGFIIHPNGGACLGISEASTSSKTLSCSRCTLGKWGLFPLNVTSWDLFMFSQIITTENTSFGPFQRQVPEVFGGISLDLFLCQNPGVGWKMDPGWWQLIYFVCLPLFFWGNFFHWYSVLTKYSKINYLVVSNSSLCSPQTLGKMNPIWRTYFSDGLVQPPTLVIYSIWPIWNVLSSLCWNIPCLKFFLGGINSCKKWLKSYLYRWWFRIFFMFHPEPWGKTNKQTILTCTYVSKGVWFNNQL